MSTLIIDSSQPTARVALVKDEQIVGEKKWEADKTLGVKLLEAVDELGRGEKVDKIAVHRGPGNFMATRTGVVTAKILAQVWGVKLTELPKALDTLT